MRWLALERKYYIDNIRWICTLLLFPFHTLRVFDPFGELFYVSGTGIPAAQLFFIILHTWFMPLLFLLAGVGSAYALNKRTAKEYIKERVFKLLIPVVIGILLLVPIQTYIAEISNNGYTGSYLGQYILFFTKPTDLSGYTGGFTPAHLWFIIFLFGISVISLPAMYFYQKSSKRIPAHKIPLPVLLTFCIIPIFTQMILNIGGKSVGEYLTWFLFGYFFISSDTIQDKLKKYRLLLLGLAVASVLLLEFAAFQIGEISEILIMLLYYLYAWTFILAVIGFGKRYLNFSNKATAYLSQSSFAVYVFHQQWIVVAGYFILKWIGNVPLQVLSVLCAGVILTFLSYAAARRFKVTRFMFGIKT